MVLRTFERLPDPFCFHVTLSKITHHERTLPLRRNEIRMTRAKGATGSKVFQIPLFPPLAKGAERGFLVFFAFLASWRDQKNHFSCPFCAAARSARTILTYPVHMQRLPLRPTRISSSVGSALSRSSSRAAKIIPGVQNPHCSACG